MGSHGRGRGAEAPSEPDGAPARPARLSYAEIGALVRRAQAGDQEGWETLVRQLSPAIYRGISAFRLSPDARDEVYANTWLRLIEHLDTIRQPESIVSWLMTTARHEALAHLRVTARLIASGELDEEGDRAAGHRELDEALLDNELQVAVHTAFRRLPPWCQDVLRLLTIDPPLTYDEITVVLGLPRGSIGPQRMRCLAKLRLMPELVVFTNELGKGD